MYSHNTDLTRLNCYNNQLTSLDVSQNAALTGLICYNNQLTSLDVQYNTALTSLSCYSNQLTSLDVSQNTALHTLYCLQNQLTYLNIKNGNNTNMPAAQFNAYPNSLAQITCDNVTNATATYITPFIGTQSNTWIVDLSVTFVL
jgi:Leucine-rich repeat (LRR) protein